MKLSRPTSAAAGILAASALLLSACGSDNNAASTTAGGSAAPAVSCEGKDTLAAEGSSAQQNAMANFVAAYQGACPGKNLSYNASGSGTGRKQFVAGQVDFAGSDSAIKGDEATAAKARCQGGDAWNIPMVVGPIALAYNLPGVSGLTLNADVTAALFNGGITTWNDPKIAALNPGVDLPSTPVAPQFRSDSSGTTDNFQTYLSTAAPTVWTQGAGSDFKGGAGQGSKGSSGVAQAVGATQGSIAYVEKSFADQGKLSVAKVDNGGGATELSTAAVQKTLDAAKFKDDSNNLVIDLTSVFGSTEAGAYPIVLATYEIVCSTGYDAPTSGAVKTFLTVAANQGQSGLEEQGYVPLPSAFQARVVKAVDAIA
ncbi:phosphate ABC transporter substrate-binding protein PstS [Rhodococcus aerolatus]